MTLKQLFEHFMLAGHGRAFELLQGHEEEYRNIVLYGCLNDISFDLQSEGARSFFMYHLALQYDNYEYFLIPAIKKLHSAEVNTDWHIINHLCDFISYFAFDSGNENALNAIVQKYDELYSLMMSMKFSLRAKRVIESFEYAAITIMQLEDFSRTLQIFKDVGAYFIKRRHTPSDSLKGLFIWFFQLSQEKFGEKYIEQQLNKNSECSKEITRFKKIMFTPTKEYSGSNYKFPDTAQEFIRKIESSSIKRRDVVHFAWKAGAAEKRRLAEAALLENNMNKKAKLLDAFTFDNNVFPMNPEQIIEYARSEHRELRNTALCVLSHMQADCIHDFAIESLGKSFSTDALEILIRNYKERDKDFIFCQLEKIKINQDNTSGWHNVILQILHTADEIYLPRRIFYFYL